jgi:hypothetical protein
MSHGDGIEPYDPRKERRSPARYSDDPYDRDEYDEEDRRRLRVKEPQRSGLVLSVGIVAICYGSLLLFCGVLSGVGGALCTAFVPAIKNFADAVAPNDPDMAQAIQDLGQAEKGAWLFIAIGLLNIAVGSGLIGSGIGVLRRSNVARFILLGVALLNILADCIDIAGKLALDLLDWDDAVTTPTSALLAVGFAVFAFLVLLLPRYAKEFAG